MDNAKILVILASVVFSSCATQTRLYVPLSDESKNSIRSSTVVFTTQNSLSVEIGRSDVSKSTSYAVGGLLAAAVDVAVDGYRQADAENHAGALRVEWEKYDLNSEIRKRVDAKLSGINWLHVIDLKDHIGTVSYGDSSVSDFDQLTTDTLTVIKSYSYLHDNLDFITTKMIIDIYVKDEHGKFVTEPIYENTLFSVYSLPSPIADKSTALSLWSENNNHHLKAAFDEGIERVTRRLVFGLENPHRTDWVN